MSQLQIKLLRGFFTLVAVVMASLIALFVYFRQKEYELTKQRYLEEGVDVLSSQLEQALGVVSHNWARCLNICKSFRDTRTDFDVEELNRGFLELDNSQFKQTAHHRVASLLNSQVVWHAFQLAMAHTTSTNSEITKEFPEVIRIRMKTDRIATDHKTLAEKLAADLEELHIKGARFGPLLHELHTLGRLLEAERLSLKRVGKFSKRMEVVEMIARLEEKYPKPVEVERGAA
jgi:hypothetical protein